MCCLANGVPLKTYQDSESSGGSGPSPIGSIRHMRQACNCNKPGQEGQANMTEPAKVR
jgi:hypothetical protein